MHSFLGAQKCMRKIENEKNLLRYCNKRTVSFSIDTLLPVLIFANIDFVYGGDFADDGADGYDGFAFFVYHACWGDAVFLEAVECVAAYCGTFTLGKNENFAFDAYAL